MDILISADELEQAPGAVRNWLANMLVRQLSPPSAADPAAARPPSLADVSASDAVTLFERLRNDYFACQVLLEFGRDSAVPQPEPAGIHRLAVTDVLHHLRLNGPQQFVAALNRIGEVWAEIAHSTQTPLFAMDEAGNIYVSKATQGSLRALWHQLVTERYADFVDGNPSGPSVPIDGMQPGRFG